MLLPTRDPLSRRQTLAGDTPSGSGPNVITIVAIVVVVLFAIAVILYAFFRNSHKTRRDNKYLPGDTLMQKIGRWRKPGRGEYSAQLQPNPSAPSLIGRDGRRSRDNSREPSIDRRAHDPERDPLSTAEAGENNATTTAAAGVDRNTSVRSVMTLPAYTPAARPTEQVVAREGERGGIDTVLEFPEDAEEEERRRDDEMESLYQIRRQRRQEQIEREERRQQRREARERGDFETLRRLQGESRARAESSSSGTVITSAALIAEHQAATAARDRRVSSVQYAGFGVARHDGSRIRGNSTDSDNRPLIDSAASISGMSLGHPSPHSRGRSASSVLSMSTTNGSDDGNGTPQLDDNGFEIITLEPSRTTNGTRSRASSNVSAHEVDVTDLGIQLPTDLPPQYDDPPDYTSPVSARPSIRSIGPPPRLPSLRSIPSIEVTGAVSPLTPTPTSERDMRSYDIPSHPAQAHR